MSSQPSLNRKMWVSTVIIELIGIIVVSVGIGIELAMRADFGFLIITGGGLLVAAGGALYAKFLRHA